MHGGIRIYAWLTCSFVGRRPNMKFDLGLYAIKWKKTLLHQTKMYFYWAIAPISFPSRKIIKWKQENLCNVYTFYFTTNTWKNRKKRKKRKNSVAINTLSCILYRNIATSNNLNYPTSVFLSVCRHPIWFKIEAHTIYIHPI